MLLCNCWMSYLKRVVGRIYSLLVVRLQIATNVISPDVNAV